MNAEGHERLSGEIRALQEKLAQQEALSSQLRRYVEDLHQLMAQRDSAKAAEARALRAREDLLAQMSSDFRQPLNLIVGFAQVLLARPKSDGDRDALARILDAGLGLERLIDSVLQKIREQFDPEVGSDRPQAIALIEEISGAAERLCALRGIRFPSAAVEFADAALRVRTDLARFRVAIEHLLDALCGLPGTNALALMAQRESTRLQLCFSAQGSDESLRADRLQLSQALLRSCGARLEVAGEDQSASVTLSLPLIGDSG